MKKYGVEIMELANRVIEVDANSYEEAQEKAEEMYRNEEVVLDHEDFNGAFYDPYPSQKIKCNYKITIEYDKKTNTLKMSDSNNKVQESECKSKEDFIFLVENYSRENLPIDKVIPLEQERPKKNKDRER